MRLSGDSCGCKDLSNMFLITDNNLYILSKARLV